MSEVPNTVLFRKILLPALFVSGLFWRHTCSFTASIQSLLWASDGTTWSAVVLAPKSAAVRTAYNSLWMVNQHMSTYLPDSEISRFNRHDTKIFPISAQTSEVIQTSLRIHQKSDKAFDITIGPLVNGMAWIPTVKTVPTTDELTTYSEYVGSNLLSLTDDHLKNPTKEQESISQP